MTSKECLEKFKLLYENKCKENPRNLIDFDMCYITIKQDLARLEKLEKAIKILQFSLDLYIETNEELDILIANEVQTISKKESKLLKEVLGYDK